MNDINKIINNDEIDLFEIIKLVWDKKNFLLITVILMTLCFLIISFLIPNKYESTLLMVADEESSIQDSFSQYSALAGIAGISLPTETSQGEIGIEVLKSRILTEKFIKKHNLLIPLFASKKWDHETEELILDKNIYNIDTKKWTRKIDYPYGLIPSSNEAYELWIDEVFSYDYDEQTGFIKVYIKHHSPVLAQKWAELLVEELNNHMRKIAVDEANLAIEYLEEEIQQTQSEELKLLFYRLIQSKIEKNMLAYSRDEYLFRVIDPPFMPEEHSSPNRIIITFLGTFLGLIFGVIIIFFREWRSHNKN